MSNKNKNYELTYAQLKKYPGFELVTEEKAKEICSGIKELSGLLYDVFQHQQGRKLNSRGYDMGIDEIK